MENLSLLSEKVANNYRGFKSYVIPSEQISLTETGLFSTGKNEFPLAFEGLDQFASIAEIPKSFFRTLESDIRAMLFNRRFKARFNDKKIPRNIRINLNNESHIIGFDDPKLFRINPVKLMDTIISSLPKNLSAEKVGVGRAEIGTNMLHISCFSPENVTEPRPGDVVSGGVDILHHVSGDSGTQVNCYLKRLVCSNGAIAHICQNEKSLRVRRLNNNQFDQEDMLSQIKDRLGKAWVEINEKLEAIETLTKKERTTLDFLEQQRTRFSLNKNMLNAIEKAIYQDELGPTGTQYDIYNALSRVATHNRRLTFRQHRMLSRLAGEFSQQDFHKCDKCGSWLS